MHRQPLVRSVFLTAVCLLPALALAQPVPSRDPDTTHLYPAGGQRGTTVPLRVGTECFPPGAQLKFYGTGLQASEWLEQELTAADRIDEPSPRRKPDQIPISYPREWQAEVSIDAAADVGPHFWRATCAQGGSRARVFVVGDLPERLETEGNSHPDQAERIELPVTLNGRIAGDRDLDYYVFTATEGELITCDVFAGRLGSPLDPVVTIYDPDGRRVEAQQVHVGVDPVLAFRAPQDGNYRLLIANVNLYGGPNYVYRMTIAADSRPLLAFPAGGQADSTRELELLSPDGAGGWLSSRATLNLPAYIADGTICWQGANDCQLRLPIGTQNERIENDNNQSADQAMGVNQPVTIHGRFGSASDEDWFKITAERGERLALDAAPVPHASRAAPVLTIWNSQRKRLQQVSTYQNPGAGCHLEWTVPAQGDYFVQLHDARHGFRGGPDFVYRLSIRHASADFALSWTQGQLNVTPGEQATLTLNIEPKGRFDQPITLECRDLPQGVTFEPRELPAGKSSVKLTVAVADDVRPTDIPLEFIGIAQTGKGEIRRHVQAPHAGQDSTGVGLGRQHLDVLYLTIRHKPVFRLYCSEAYLYAHRGMVFPYQMEIERLDDYRGEIVLQSGDRQNRDLDGVLLQRNVVPGDRFETHMPIYLPETMHANVQSQSQLYVQGYTQFLDRWGDKQSLLVVSEKRCMLRTLPTVVRLEATTDTIIAAPGASVQCKLRLKRTSNFTGPMRLSLVDPPLGIRMDSITLEAGEQNAECSINIPSGVPVGEQIQLRFRGQGVYPGHLSLVSEATVRIQLR